jgi:phosphatidylserine/phosphatidylglycerophosphate/cardiolipin synthase-like enzyme
MLRKLLNCKSILTIAFISVALLLATGAKAQILTYTNDTTGALATIATNATGTALTRVNGAVHPSSTICSTGFSSSNFQATTTYSDTLAAVEADAAANTGYTLNVTGFSVDTRKSTTGPANVRFAYSTDGGATWTDQGINQTPGSGTCGTTATGTWTTSLTVASPSQLKFRVYAFNAGATTGTFQILNLIINGTVTGATTSCGIPTGLGDTLITTSSATLFWSAVTGATSYNIQYRPVGSSTWSSTTSGTTSVSVTGLTPGTTYEFQVQAVCPSGTSAYSGSTTFTTLSAASCGMATGLTASSITTTSATLSWTAVAGATSYNIQYRVVGTSTWSTTTSGTTSVNLTALTAATNYEYQVQAVCSSGTGSFTGSSTFTTAGGSSSCSSGKMAIYFNQPVDNTVAHGVNAVYLNNCMADTIIAYINRAKYSIDIAQYDYNQSSGFGNIATAVNNAYLAGKKVRWIYDGSQSNTGIALLNSGIHTLARPTGAGIMHNKFVIIDANSTNPNDAIVNTGSEDWGLTQFNQSFNNMVFIQDSALAHAYTKEFNMMWGDTGVVPNATAALFGSAKTDVGTHSFVIGGRTVELYFSPTDNTDSHIQSSINSANTDLYFGVYDFTGSTDANDIVARQTAGVYTRGIVDTTSAAMSPAYPILTSGLGTHMLIYSGSGSVVYHNKMLIVDPSNTCSDPLVLTGSHNWTTSANTQNDENILIIHNDTVANIYYQSFRQNYIGMGGTLTIPAPCSTSHVIPVYGIKESAKIYPNPTDGNINIEYNLPASQNAAVEIFNVLGQKIAVVANELQEAGNHNYSVMLPENGMYYVHFVTGDEQFTLKVAVANK